jgi:hypothetical protein
MEILLGIKPMNLLDSTAVPIDIFGDEADLTPFQAKLPDVALDNLFPPDKESAALRSFMALTAKQDLTHQDMADPTELNKIIWFSVRGNSVEMPVASPLPVFDLMTAGLLKVNEVEEQEGSADSEDNDTENAE